MSVQSVIKKSAFEEAVEAKLKILEDLYIVDKCNYREYKEKLIAAVNENPYSNHEVVLDRVCRKIIMNT